MSIGPEASPEQIKEILDKIRERREPLPEEVKNIDKHDKSRKCPINKRIREHRKKGIIPCGGECQYSLEITFSSFANLASIKCECGEEQYLGEI